MTALKGVSAQRVKNFMRAGRTVKTVGLGDRPKYPVDSGTGYTDLGQRAWCHNVKRVFWSPTASFVMFVTAIKPDGRSRIGPGGTQRQESIGDREIQPSRSYGRVGGLTP
jgi:hypothetical protein